MNAMYKPQQDHPHTISVDDIDPEGGTVSSILSLQRNITELRELLDTEITTLQDALQDEVVILQDALKASSNALESALAANYSELKAEISKIKTKG